MIVTGECGAETAVITIAKQCCNIFPSTYFPRLRGRLHGEFQPGLKFRSAHQAEIFLRLHDKFQPGRNVQNWAGNVCREAFYIHNSCGAHAQVHIARAETGM